MPSGGRGREGQGTVDRSFTSFERERGPVDRFFTNIYLKFCGSIETQRPSQGSERVNSTSSSRETQTEAALACYITVNFRLDLTQFSRVTSDRLTGKVLTSTCDQSVHVKPSEYCLLLFNRKK